MISLKEFVAEAIAQISEGVVEAQKRVKELNGTVNPTNVNIGPKVREEHCFTSKSDGLNVVQPVSFDVAVTAEESKDKKGGVGVAVGIFSLGAGGHSDTKSSSAS